MPVPEIDEEDNSRRDLEAQATTEPDNESVIANEIETVLPQESPVGAPVEAEDQPTELVGAFGVRTTANGGLELTAAGLSSEFDVPDNQEETIPDGIAEESGDLAVATPVSADLPHAEEWSERRESSRLYSEREKPEPCHANRRNKGFIGGFFFVLVATAFWLVYLGSVNSGSDDDSIVIEGPQTQEEHLHSLLPEYSLASVRDPGTPQAKAFRWMLEDPNFESYTEQRLVQRFALATFYYATGGDSIAGWTKSDNWLSWDHHECEWFSTSIKAATSVGAFIGGGGQEYYNISELDTSLCNGEKGEEYQLILLHGNGMDGTLPEELYLLTTLQAISLRNNQLQGTLSSRVGQLSRLFVLDVSNNDMSGSIPTEVGLLHNITGLFLFYNEMAGHLPSEIGELSALMYLIIDSMRLSGTLPTELGALQELQGLLAHHNDFSGTIPSEIGESNMHELFLFNTSLTGTLPTELGKMDELAFLFIGESQLSGTIPTEVGQMSSCVYFCLFDTVVTGTLPPELGNISTMEGILLSRNALTGSIPAALGPNALLWGISAFDNSFSGTIPTEVFHHDHFVLIQLNGNFLTGTIPSQLGVNGRLEILDLSSNRLTGELPSELGQATGLQELRIDNNLLTGTIPTALGSLFHSTFSIIRFFMSFPFPEILQTAIPWRSLSLAGNSLTGPIPSEFGRMKRLLNLSLCDNQLSGSIPVEIGMMNGLEYLNLQNNHLMGPISTELCQTTSLKVLNLSSNNFSGKDCWNNDNLDAHT